jgi:hypothetical protein
MERIKWERGPFSQCPRCKQETFGFLSAGGSNLRMRCSACRYSEIEELPAIDKRVIYLDQFFFSTMFNLRSGGRLPKGHEAFFTEANCLLERIVLLQQAVLPHSDLHHNETIVFRDARGLQEAYEQIGGAVTLKDTTTIEQEQVGEFLIAYLDGREPALDLSEDAGLQRARNVWLNDIRIAVNTNYAQFAPGLRADRDRTHQARQSLVEGWANEKPNFQAALKRELAAFGDARRAVVRRMLAQSISATTEEDLDALFDACMHPHWAEFCLFRRLLMSRGMSDDDANRKVIEFWGCPSTEFIPCSRISSYLFAAVARRATGGQRKFTRGLMTDIKAISAYAPYVDAMFIDKECANILSEEPLRSDLHYRARIFSVANRDEFIGYLEGIEAATPDGVRAYAQRIYGVG